MQAKMFRDSYGVTAMNKSAFEIPASLRSIIELAAPVMVSKST